MTVDLSKLIVTLELWYIFADVTSVEKDLFFACIMQLPTIAAILLQNLHVCSVNVT